MEEVQGVRNGKPYRGLLYMALDGGGNAHKVEARPIKSSLLGKSCGYEALENRTERSAEMIAKDNSCEHARRRVADALAGLSTLSELRERLRAHRIDLYIRRNTAGRITGATFIDYESRCVFNGSRLGKEYSANALQERFGMGLESGAGFDSGARDYGCGADQGNREGLQPVQATAHEIRQSRPALQRIIPNKSGKKP
jgi:hypothetical protein